jgi:hypothetical protein
VATNAQLKAAIKALSEPQKSVAQAIYNQANGTGAGVSANEITYIMNNLSSITSSTDPKTFLGTATQRVTANKTNTVVPGYTTTATTDATTPAVAAEATAPVDFTTQYSVQAAVVNSDPGLKTLFDQAVAEKWTPERFTVEFQKSTWYQGHAQSWREAETARLTDPGTWDQSIKDLSAQIKQTATGMGISLTDQQVTDLANQTSYSSWGKGIDTGLLRTHIVDTGRISGTGGEASQTIDKLKNYAYAMGVDYNDDWYNTQTQNVLAGKMTLEESNNAIKEIAKSKYGAFASQIDAGATVQQIASPYMNSMANILELNPADIKLSDVNINKALTNLTSDSKPALQPLWQFENELRKDPRWNQTKNARDAMDSTARSVLSSFGLVN